MPVAVSVCAMVAPDPADAPVTLVWLTVQENVAPATLLVRATDVAPPEHNDCEEGVAVTLGTGLTVTVATMGTPAQLPTLGVIV